MSRISIAGRDLKGIIKNILKEAAGQNLIKIIEDYLKKTEYDILESWGNCAFYTKDFNEKMGGRIVYMPLIDTPGEDPEDHIVPVLGTTIIDFAYVPGQGVSHRDRTGVPPRFNPGWKDGSWPLLTKLSDEAFKKTGRYGKLGYLKGGKYADWEYGAFPQLKNGEYPIVLKSLPEFATLKPPTSKTKTK